MTTTERYRFESCIDGVWKTHTDNLTEPMARWFVDMFTHPHLEPVGGEQNISGWRAVHVKEEITVLEERDH